MRSPSPFVPAPRPRRFGVRRAARPALTLRLAGVALLVSALGGAAACAGSPPARFAEGGAPLALGRARWERGEGHVVDLMPDGRVLEDGDPKWVLDGGGRVYDKGKDPLAILQPDGVLVGNEETPLGIVGTVSASAPGSTTAWLLLQPDGLVVAYDQEGAPLHAGQWRGCEGAMARTCLLITHLSRTEARNRAAQAGVGFGFGFGVGVGR